MTQQLSIIEEAQAKIGREFAELMQSLPVLNGYDWVKRLEMMFAMTKKVSDEEMVGLLAEPSAKAAGEFAQPLATIGITPLDIYWAIEAITKLLQRLIECGQLSKTAVIFATVGGNIRVDGQRHKLLTRVLIMDEIKRVLEGRPARGFIISSLLIKIAAHVPNLFHGFICEPTPDDVGITIRYVDPPLQPIFSN